jgi:hypothetical protein
MNWNLVKWTCAGLAVLLLLAAGIRAVQLSRLSAKLWAEAQRSAADKDWATAEECLAQYLALHPEDLPALRLCGEVSSRPGADERSRRRAANAYARVVELEPNDDAGRLAWANLLVEGHPTRALEQVDRLLAVQSDWPQPLAIKAEANYRLWKTGGDRTAADAVAGFEAWADVEPSRVEPAARMALIAVEAAQDEKTADPLSLLRRAQGALDRTVHLAKTPEAYMARFAWRQLLGDIGPEGELDRDVQDALALDANQLEANLAAAQAMAPAAFGRSLYDWGPRQSISEERRKAAAEYLQRAMQEHPEDERAFSAWVELGRMNDPQRKGAAEALWVQERLPEMSWPLRARCTSTLVDSGDVAAAEGALAALDIVTSSDPVKVGKESVVDPRHAYAALLRARWERLSGKSSQKERLPELIELQAQFKGTTLEPLLAAEVAHLQPE